MQLPCQLKQTTDSATQRPLLALICGNRRQLFAAAAIDYRRYRDSKQTLNTGWHASCSIFYTKDESAAAHEAPTASTVAENKAYQGIWLEMKRQTDNRYRFGVSILTACRNDWRISDAIQGLRPTPARSTLSVVFIAAFIMSGLTFTSQATEWQSNDEIARIAEEFAKNRFGKSDKRVKPVAGHLDSRLRLPHCSSGPEAFVRPGTKVNSRIVVGVRCTGSQPWKVYVPVDVVVMQPVLVAKRAFPRGHVLAGDDVVFADHDVSRLTGGYLSSLDELSGKRLKQQLIAGRIVTPSMLVAETLVRRGQSVTLVVRNAKMNISMAGTAMSDGALNQRIRVENTNSQRVVEGVVRSPETVEILVHQ